MSHWDWASFVVGVGTGAVCGMITGAIGGLLLLARGMGD